MQTINQAKLDVFFAEYEIQLREAIKLYPAEYHYSVDYAPVVARRMKEAVVKGSHNITGRAFKMTCKKMDVRHTYKDFDVYIHSD